MPRDKNSRKQSTSDSDSGPDDKTPVAKKARRDDEENSWDLGNRRFVKLSEFKGKWYVNIREFYDAGGELKPTKKGVMLTMEQWHKFKGCIDDINEAIKRNV